MNRVELCRKREKKKKKRARMRERRGVERQRGAEEIVITPFEQSVLWMKEEIRLCFLSSLCRGTRHALKLPVAQCRAAIWKQIISDIKACTDRKFILGCGWITYLRKSKQHPISKMMGLDNSNAARCRGPSHHIPNNKQYAKGSRLWHYNASFYFLFIWSILYDRHAFLSLSHQRHTQQILCVIEQLCSTQQCSHYTGMVCVCMRMSMWWIDCRWCGGERSSSYVSSPGSSLLPPSSLHYLLLLSF